MRLRILSAGANTPEVGVSSSIYVTVEAPFPTGPVAIPYLVRMSCQVRVTGVQDPPDLGGGHPFQTAPRWLTMNA